MAVKKEKAPRYVTTAADFKLFVECAKHWAKQCGLMDWEFVWRHVKLEDQIANVSYSYVARQASVALSTHWGETSEVTAKNLRETARHEMIHLLLADLRWLADRQFESTQAMLNAAEHALMHKIEYLINRPA